VADGDRFRCRISPGLEVITDEAGCVVLESRRPRHTVTNVAALVVALETARDMGAGGPSAGSPTQRAAAAVAAMAASLEDRLIMAGPGESRIIAGDTAQQLWQLQADILYGPLPAEWLEHRLSSAGYCRTCRARTRIVGHSAVLRHRPGCPDRDIGLYDSPER
jgi:hypothetical protein